MVALLHFVPGIAVFAVYLVAAPLFVKSGVPRVAGLLFAFVVAGIPLQLAIMRRAAKAEGKRSIRELLAWQKPMPIWMLLLLVIGAFGLALAMLSFLPLDRVSTYLAEKVFWWVPEAARPSEASAGAGTAVLIVLILQVLIDGLTNPIVEELYFRGFLLPRLGTLGWAAPVVNTVLFALAHFWQQYQYVTIFVMVLPLTLITWWRKNIRVQLVSHCLANTIGASMSLAAFLQGGS